MRATCRLSQKPLMRSSSSAFSIMSMNISEATCSAKRCGSRNSTERLSFLSLEWKRFRCFGSMIQAIRSQRTLQTIYPTRASVNIESKGRLWISSFTREACSETKFRTAFGLSAEDVASNARSASGARCHRVRGHLPALGDSGSK